MVFAEHCIQLAEAQPDAVAKLRGIHIEKEDLEAFGYTPDCKRCHSAVTYGAVQGSMPHSATCRLRVTEELRQTRRGGSRRTDDNEDR